MSYLSILFPIEELPQRYFILTNLCLHKKLQKEYGVDFVRLLGGDWVSFPKTTFEKNIEMFKECAREYAKNGKFYTFEDLKKLNLNL